jgi:hypothetical protein
MASALREQIGEQCAVGEVDWDEDGARNVILVEIKLLEQGREEGGGGEGVVGCWLLVVGWGWIGEGGVLFGDG